jgi:hypothetical protein
MKIKHKAQVTAEYAILISLVIAAAMGMSNEIRRGIQAKMHDAMKSFQSNTSFGGATTWQYEPQVGTRDTNTEYSNRERWERFLEDTGEGTEWTEISENTKVGFNSTISQ